MKVLCSCPQRYFDCVFLPKATAGCDRDAIAGTADKAGECISTGEHVGLATGGQDAITARRDDIFQRLI